MKKFSKEHRRKLSIALTGKRRSEETKKKISEANKGQIPWNKGEKIYYYSSRMLGRHHSLKAKKKISSTLMGRKFSKKSIKKMSEARRGIKFSKEHREKLSKAWEKRIVSEETKEKMKKTWNTPKMKKYARLRRLKQRLPTIDTSLEKKTKKWLEERKLKYIHPFNLGNKFQCDFYIPSLNLIVECDGAYWHSLPENKKRDKAKDSYVKKCGFNMIRLSEKQINQNQFLKYKEHLAGK